MRLLAIVLAAFVCLGNGAARAVDECVHAAWLDAKPKSHLDFLGPSEFLGPNDFPILYGRVLDPATGREIASVPHGAFPLGSGNLAMVFDDKGAASIWSVEPWRQVLALPPSDSKIWQTPAGRYLWVNDKGENFLLRLPDGREVLRLPERFRLEVSPDDRRLATFTDDGRPEVELWDLDTGARIATLIHSGPVGRVKLANDGGLIAISSPKSRSPDPSNVAFTLWDGSTGQKLAAFTATSKFVEFSRDGRHVAVEIGERVAILGQTGRFQPRYLAREVKDYEVEGAAGGALILKGGESSWTGQKFENRNWIEAIDFDTGRKVIEFPGGTAVISVDGQWIAIGDPTEGADDPGSPEVLLVDAAVMKPVCKITRPHGFADIRISPHGRFLVIGAKLFEIPSDSSRRRLNVMLLAKSTTLPPNRREEVQAMFSQAFRDFQSGDFEKAIAGFTEGLEIDPFDGRAHFYLAETYIRVNKPELAREHYRKAVEFAPGTKEAALAEAELQKQ